MTKKLKSIFGDTFSPLKIRNYRLYYIGQIVSTSGTFMQAIAQSWLVLELTHSGTALGLATALQFLPMLLLGPWGGLIADRFSKRHVLYLTQSIAGALAIGLGLLVATDAVRLWMVYIFALCLGFINLIDNPARQTFIFEMVGGDKLKNAVSLYATLVSMSRVVGPVIAGVLIATVGLAPCFILNGISFAAVIAMLYAMNADELNPTRPVSRAKGQFREGFRHVLDRPVLLGTLILLSIVGTFTFEFQVSLPLLAQETFHGGASTYSALSAAMGLGSVVGGFLTAGLKKTSSRVLIWSAFLFGVATIVLSLMPTLYSAMIAVVVVGAFSIFFIALGNTTLQLESRPELRGRVMAFYGMAFLGSTAIGGPIIGWIGENLSARWSLAAGGVAAIIAVPLGIFFLRGAKSHQITDQVEVVAQASEEDRRVL